MNERYRRSRVQIEMTGKEDRLSPWKYAIGGYPGSGKTLLASTAPNPLFVFFRENPRIKSIANRYVPHVKVLNDDTASVLEKMQALAVHLELTGEYETLVVDTGDELQVAMKEARRIRNGGEFGVSDWGWLGDTYRELMTTLIDLPMRVIVLFHVKNSQEGDDGQMIRELLLQGSVKDEASGWFDVVGALDTFEVGDEQGDLETHRVLLTHSSRLYPWLKDHSGNLPRRYELSAGFVNDISGIEDVLNSTEIAAEKAVLSEVNTTTDPDQDPAVAAASPLTPEQLEEAKNPDTPEINKALDAVAEVLDIAEVVEPSHEEAEEATVEDPPVEVDTPVVEADQASLLDQPEEETSSEQEEKSVAAQMCEVCGEVAPDDVITVSKIRFKKVLCRNHFKEKLKAS
jgi:hypothetical protein